MIYIENITKKYPNGKEALKGVSLNIEKGEILGLLGVNGSGKTTLSTILATLHPPTSGDVKYLNQSIFKNINQFRRLVAYCPQKPNLNDLLTVEQNLYFDALYFGASKKEAEKRLDKIVDEFNLNDYRKFKPSELSGGYQQRTMIARALMHEPEFVILDEPTVGLDPSIRRKLWKIIKDLNKTILLTTHYLDEADVLSDRICVLEKGKIIFLDTKENLKNKHTEANSNNNNNLEDIFIRLTEEETVG